MIKKHLFSLILIALTSTPLFASDSPFLMHYWSFNNESTFMTPDISLDGGELVAVLNGSTEILTGTGQDFSSENARNNEPAGAHLRFNNPVGSSLTFKVPTTGFDQIRMSFETRRSNNGANTQYLTYTLNGVDFLPLQIVEVTTVPTVITLDFTAIEGVEDNPDFAVRIEFNDSNTPPNLAGNNRFDNVVVEGIPLGDTALPPVVAHPRELLQLFVGQSIDLTRLARSIYDYQNPEELEFSIDFESNPFFDFAVPAGDNSVSGGFLVGSRAGEAVLTLGAKGLNTPVVSTSMRVLVYPAAHRLRDGSFTFTSWSQDSPALTFPDNMIFLQSDMNDPGLEDELLFAYFIPLGEYADADLVNVGFPYRNSSRTRINGLGSDGISFINTGRGRDLGGALVALDTREVSRATFSFTAGTELANSRVYAIRAQYRVMREDGNQGEADFGGWKDVTLPLGEPIEYMRREEGHETRFINLDLPAEMLGEDYVQLLFRYYFTGTRLSEDSGARDMLRLDDIEIQDLTGVSAFEGDDIPGRFVLEQNYPNPFNPVTTIRFSLPMDQHARVSVYNLLGQQVAVLVNETLRAGVHEVRFDGSGLASGIYLYRLETDSFTSTMRMTLMK